MSAEPDPAQRDPDCTCTMEYPSMQREWCEHCLTAGPLPGSLADPATAEPKPRRQEVVLTHHTLGMRPYVVVEFVQSDTAPQDVNVELSFGGFGPPALRSMLQIALESLPDEFDCPGCTDAVTVRTGGPGQAVPELRAHKCPLGEGSIPPPARRTPGGGSR